MSAPLLRFDGVSKSYATASETVQAICELNLIIEQGEFVTVSGPSGSGKSTFLQIAGCLDTPTAGTVCIDGVDVASLTDDARSRLRAKVVGFVFQQYNLLPRMSALENVALPLVYAGVRGAERYARAADLLERLGLAEHAEHLPGQLSGGQQQRVAIARALINQPRLLLADEPTGALDTRTGAALMNIFSGLNEVGTTIVVVTHETSVARLGRRRIGFRDGFVVADELAEASGAHR